MVGSTELDVNWRALVSNKIAKPGWYRAYCRSHPVWDWPVWVSICPSCPMSVYICQTFIKVSYEIKKYETVHSQDSMQTTAYVDQTHSSSGFPIKLHICLLKQNGYSYGSILQWNGGCIEKTIKRERLWRSVRFGSLNTCKSKQRQPPASLKGWWPPLPPFSLTWQPLITSLLL